MIFATAALQEGVDALAVGSYHGGHLQVFPHLLDRLVAAGIAGTPVFAGGGKTTAAFLAEGLRMKVAAGAGTSSAHCRRACGDGRTLPEEALRGRRIRPETGEREENDYEQARHIAG